MIQPRKLIAATALYTLLSTGVAVQANPPCYVCDGDPTATINNPDGLVTLPDEFAVQFGVDQVACSLIFNAGMSGFISEANCLTDDPDADALQEYCGCSNFVAATEPPVAAPVDAPIEPPVDAPVKEPVDAPIEPPAETPVDAPVDEPTPVLAPTDSKCKGKNECKEGKKGTKGEKENKDPKAAKGTKTINEPKVEKGTDDPKEPRTAKDAKTQNEPKVGKDIETPKETKVKKAAKTQKEPKLKKDIETPKEPKVEKGAKTQKEPKAEKDDKVLKDQKEVKTPGVGKATEGTTVIDTPSPSSTSTPLPPPSGGIEGTAAPTPGISRNLRAMY